MTRQVKGPGTAVLEREYIYSEPPVSITDLATKYGLARSNVAAKATTGKWFEKREEFRARLSDGVKEALAEKWVEAQSAFREKILTAGASYLDRWIEELNKEGSTIKVNTRDMLGIAAMMRVTLDDIRKEAVPSTVVVDEEGNVEFADATEAKIALAKAKAMLLGAGDAEDEGDGA